jgi:hypothetical protein
MLAFRPADRNRCAGVDRGRVILLVMRFEPAALDQQEHIAAAAS